MTSSFSADITIDAGDKARAVYDSINIDNTFYPENPVKTNVNLDDKHNSIIHIHVKSNHLAHLRANLNSTLRLVQTSYDSIESVKI